MSVPDDTISDGARPPRASPSPALLVPCLLIALLCAIVPVASLRKLGAPWWLAIVAALLAFPILPFLWHTLTERRRTAARDGTGPALERFGLRSLGVGLLVLAVSFANLGPRQLGGALITLVRPPRAVAPPPPPVPDTARPRPANRHELEPFLPADASAVVALSDPALMRQLLAAAGADTKDKLTALQKCQIFVDSARILIASRDPGTRLIVVRAPGVTDPRNLYCLAGFLGSDRLRLRFTSDKAPVRFEVDGLVPHTLRFTAVDDRTVVASDGDWGQTGGPKLFPTAEGPAEGPLAPALARVDRGASLWSVGLYHVDGGTWDLALDARVQDAHLRLRGSSIPPSGAANQAVIDTRVPLGFASALPASALQQGLSGLMGVLASAGARGAPTAPASPTRAVGKTDGQSARP